MSSDDVYDLNDGQKMTVIGLGTYRMQPGNETYSSVLAALKMGYRMVDTAALYRNEADVGRAIRDSGIPRSQIFVTTKIWDTSHGYNLALNAGLRSNATLGVGYIDLLLMHSPSTGKIVETYDAMFHLSEIGVTRSIGVSNFGVAHMEALKRYCRPVPTVNQFELHPLNFKSRKAVVDYCEKANIVVQAYGSVLSGHDDLLEMAQRIALSYNKTEAQVMLRWALDKSYQVIPKSTHTEYLAEDLDVFDFNLSDEDATSLESLAQKAQLDEYWNPLITPVHVGDVSHYPGCDTSE